MTGLCSIHLSIFSAEGPNKTPWGEMKVIREVGKKGMGGRLSVTSVQLPSGEGRSFLASYGNSVQLAVCAANTPRLHHSNHAPRSVEGSPFTTVPEPSSSASHLYVLH